jgi:hypothetical protein
MNRQDIVDAWHKENPTGWNWGNECLSSDMIDFILSLVQSMPKLFVCTNFEGAYPTGVAAIVSAHTREEAAKILENQLNEELESFDIEQEIGANQLYEFMVRDGNVEVLCNGDY